MSEKRTNPAEARLQFWKNWLGPTCPYPENRAYRLKSDKPLDNWIRNLLPDNCKSARILDLAAGPVSSLGTEAKDLDVEIVAVDDLALEYNKILTQTDVKPCVKTTFCHIEDVLATFGKASFDIIYSFNGFDFIRNPIGAYRGLLSALKPDGVIHTVHELPNELENPPPSYKHYHSHSNGRPIIYCNDPSSNSLKYDLISWLPNVDIQMQVEDRYIKLTLKKHKGDHICQSKLDNPALSHSPLISVHIPKTAGTSFRFELESAFGMNLRQMYSNEDTNPKLAHLLEFAPETKCLHGHFQLTRIRKHFPKSPFVTWLRHPVERIISSYYQFLRFDPSTMDSSPFIEEFFRERWSLLDFAQRPEIRNQVPWYIDGTPLELFAFVGITERYKESIRLFRKLFNIPQNTEIQNVNQNEEKPVESTYPVTQEQRKALEVLYANEIALYDGANRLLDQRLKQFAF